MENRLQRSEAPTWYQDLIVDIKRLEFTGIVVTKHAIGKRILQDFEKFGKPEYGGKYIETLAHDLNINSREIYRCVQFVRQWPEIDTVCQNSSWRSVIRQLRIPRPKREILPFPEGKYQVIYADPPWEYDMSKLRKEVGAHYPTMNLEELCEMGDKVKGIADNDCTLFLWVTSPLINRAFPLMTAWGFEYKTSMVWDKVKYNLGYYWSMRHEFLLVGGKGSAVPKDAKLANNIDSVQSIPKSDRHSEKPEEFRKIIETLYPDGKKIELFARGITAPGWDSWGNEVESKELDFVPAGAGNFDWDNRSGYN